MPLIRDRLARLGVAAALVIASLVVMQSLLLGRPLPTIDGYYRLLGLHERAEVVRDAFGIPRIYAENEHDLYFLQGYVTAQDRFAQMERVRREVSRERPEPIRGEGVRSALDAYAEGVTKYITQHRAARALPAEIALSGHDPEPWTADDVLRVAASLGGWSSVMCRVVPGEGSHRGRPLLMAELDTFAPGLGWYEVGLKAPGVRAVGLSLPGIPGVIAGHNGSLAWALDGSVDDPRVVLAAAEARTVGDLPMEEGCLADIRGGTHGPRAPGNDLDVEALRLRMRPTEPTAGGARIVIDLAEADGSKAALSTGQSGHRAARHYGDQKPLWEAGQLHRLAWTRGAVARTEGHLVLRPR